MKNFHRFVPFLSLVLILSASSCAVKASDIVYLGFFPGDGMKAYDGSSWSSFGKGLPADIRAEQILRDRKGTTYLTTEYHGIFRLASGDSKWVDISSPLFKRRSQLEGVNEYRRISAFCIDPANENKLYLATKHTLYSSTDAGKSWNILKPRGQHNSYYFTSLCVVDGALYAGTSFDGIYKVTDAFTDASKGIPTEFYAGDLHFHEGVSSLRFENGTFYSGYLFGRGFCLSTDHTTWKQQNLTLKDTLSESVYDAAPKGKEILVSTDQGVYSVNETSSKPDKLDADIRKASSDKGPEVLLVLPKGDQPQLFVRRNITPNTADKKITGGQKRALYVSWPKLEKDLNGFLDLAVRGGFNAVIIDVKDDFGTINAPVESKVAQELGAIRNTNIKEIIAKCHDRKLYVIARNVTFKDKRLYAAYNSKYAIWDSSTNQPWVGLPRERWCDPFSKFVRDYNIEIAKETAKLGFDEIQFDYIRYPTDGPTGHCQFRYRENADVFKSEIMGDFLQEAKRSVNVPISIDIYGYNAWYRFGNLIGQDEEFLSRFVDVICPMVYPSHFGAAFYKRFGEIEKPYKIVLDSGIRSRYFAHDRSVIRMWIQDFKYQSPTWGTEYILKQIKGVNDSGCESYSFWNPAGDHSMADRAIAEHKAGTAKNDVKKSDSTN